MGCSCSPNQRRNQHGPHLTASPPVPQPGLFIALTRYSEFFQQFTARSSSQEAIRFPACEISILLEATGAHSSLHPAAGAPKPVQDRETLWKQPDEKSRFKPWVLRAVRSCCLRSKPLRASFCLGNNHKRQLSAGLLKLWFFRLLLRAGEVPLRAAEIKIKKTLRLHQLP